MKAFVDWLLAQRRRVILLAVVAAPLIPFVAAALLALDTARRGVVPGITSAAISTALFVIIGALVPGGDLVTFALVGLLSFGSGVVIGAVLRRAGNLVLGFQGTVLLLLLGVSVLSVLGPSPQALFGGTLEQTAEVLRSTGASEEQVAMLVERMPWFLFATMFAQAIAALLLGYWWLTLAVGERRFAAEFRELRLGRVLGAVVTAVLGLGLVFEAAVVQNLVPLALLGFLCQGLAVLHAWVHARKWHPGFLVPVYVLLVTPLTILVALSLGALGFIDNWFNLRRTAPQA